jgi:hypothetical protein
MKEFTSFYDVREQPINEGDILLNPMICDLWIVENKDGIYYGYLIPNSGYIGHPEDAEYPKYTEELEVIAESFEKIGSKYDNPELLKGLKYE